MNKKLHIFGIKSSPVFLLSDLRDGTSSHIFYECDRIKCLWPDLVKYFQNSLVLTTLTLESFLDPLISSTVILNFKK